MDGSYVLVYTDWRASSVRKEEEDLARVEGRIAGKGGRREEEAHRSTPPGRVREMLEQS